MRSTATTTPPALPAAVKGAGFTLTELLVVIGVIGVLLAISLPVLNGVLSAGRQANEMAAARQLMIAHLAYSTDARDAIIPGYLRGLPAQNHRGEAIGGEPAARYPWRIAPYLDYNMRGLYTNAHAQVLEAFENPDPDNPAFADATYFASLAPSLGINGQWVGGDERESSFNAGAIAAYGKFCATHTSEIKRPDALLVFVSARGIDPLEPDPASAVVIEGYFKVLSPIFRSSAGERWSQDFDPSDEPIEFGYVSPRYPDGAVTAFVDGHADLLSEDELRDMRHWANLAKTPDYGVEARP